MEHNSKVYQKYRILDAKSGEEKKGQYFVLKLDARSCEEQKAVEAAMKAYATVKKQSGKKESINLGEAIDKLLEKRD